MHIKNGLLEGIPYRQALQIGGQIKPEVLIFHDTASSLSHGAAARYLRENERKVSVHFVLERDGSVEQQVPVFNRANHCGRSSYHGRDGVNGFSIGVEIVNPGRLTRVRGGARSWFKTTYDIDEFYIEEVATPEHGTGLWMDYTPEQIEAAEHLAELLFDGIESLRDIRTHWYISPGRKIDTNPLFPLEQIRSRVFGREDPTEDEAYKAAGPANALADNIMRVRTPGDGLNMRRWPSFNPNVITSIPHGTEVLVVREGVFGGRGWSLVQYGGQEGWVVDNYLEDA